MKGDKKRELFSKFLKENKILIVDKSSASRRRLLKTIVDMGCPRQQIFSVAHYSEASEVIQNDSPKLVLSDYSIQGGSGFDLFKKYRESVSSLDDTTLILVTSNISQSAVAKAAEEDVDSFIIKPYTVKSLEKSLVTAVINKLYPSKYMKTVDAGKQKLFEGEYEEAMSLFEEATGLSKTPSLALFYHGQAKYFMEQMDEAQIDYKAGLKFNAIHFKCQVGLFELFMKENKPNEAYDVVKNIAKYFPASPERLKQVVRLAVVTGNYEDLSDFYDIFTILEERPKDVIDYVCSGLYVLGRHYFCSGDKSSAKKVFEKVAISCMGEPKFLRALIGKYVDEKMYTEAEGLLTRFSAGAESDPLYQVSRYLAFSGAMETNERASKGLELFNNGNQDPQATKVMIRALKEAGSSKANEYLDEAKRLWPDEFQGPKPSESQAA